MDLEEAIYYDFEEFRLDTRNHILLHNNHVVNLSPKAVELLEVLVQNNTKILSKNFLIDEVWKNTFVLEANLTNYISELNKLFKIKDPSKKYIKNYSRRGYHFQVSVTPIKGLSNLLPNVYIQKFGVFEDYFALFPSLIENATEVDVYFIHSRRWRENHRSSLIKFLEKPESKLTVFLPDLDEKNLIGSLKPHFLDRAFLEQWIKDAYQDFATLYFEYKSKVCIKPYSLYPTYSFYRFDNVVVMALYPTTCSKKSVPTFLINDDSDYWSFFSDDLERLSQLDSMSEENLLKFKNLE